jgi:hypothetical protein
VTVKDNVTGLIWENKTDDLWIHDKDRTFTWCDKKPATNGGDQGTCGSDVIPTNTEAFIKSLNDAHFGGFSDWRIPEQKELQSIADYSRTNPAIDTTFFFGTLSFTLTGAYAYYWSSTTYARHTNNAWTVTFTDLPNLSLKSDSCYVRAVRREPSPSLNRHWPLVDNGDGTVTDTGTGLMWQQMSLNINLTWESALLYGETLDLAGYDDWRIPTQKELQSIVVYSRWNPAIDTTLFPGTASFYYWSSTSSNSDPYFAWSVNFDDGTVLPLSKTIADLNVRAVRGGQFQVNGHLIIDEPALPDIWNIGEHKTITWDTAGIPGKVKISLSRQGGKAGTFETITENAENTGTYNLTVPGPVTVNGVLKIEPLNDPSKFASLGLFGISGLHWLPLVLRN